MRTKKIEIPDEVMNKLNDKIGYGINSQYINSVVDIIVEHIEYNLNMLQGKTKDIKTDILYDLLNEIEVPQSFKNLLDWSNYFYDYIDSNLKYKAYVNTFEELLQLSYNDFVYEIGIILIESLLEKDLI